jgi:hypothetical protein
MSNNKKIKNQNVAANLRIPDCFEAVTNGCQHYVDGLDEELKRSMGFGVFWDYQNCPMPKKCNKSLIDVVKVLRTTFSPFAKEMRFVVGFDVKKVRLICTTTTKQSNGF